MFGRLLRYIVLPSEVTRFERDYLSRVNRIALFFFLLHIPVMMAVAALNHTGPLSALLLTTLVAAGPVLARRVLTQPRLLSVVFGVTSMLMGGLLVCALGLMFGLWIYTKLKNLPVRQELVDSVRQQIAQGTYDTPEKLDAAINELLSDQG